MKKILIVLLLCSCSQSTQPKQSAYHTQSLPSGIVGTWLDVKDTIDGDRFYLRIDSSNELSGVEFDSSRFIGYNNILFQTESYPYYSIAYGSASLGMWSADLVLSNDTLRYSNGSYRAPNGTMSSYLPVFVKVE